MITHPRRRPSIYIYIYTYIYERNIHRLREVGIEENAELVILNCKQKYYFDEVKEEGERKRKKSRIDYPKVFGSKTKIDPDKLEVTQQLIAHCTDAKQRALHVNRGHLVISTLHIYIYI